MRRLFQIGLLIALGLLSRPAHATWTLVQHPSNTSCGASTTCAVTLTSTSVAGQVAIISATGLPNSTHISSTSAAFGTLTLCSNCNTSDTSGDFIDQAYVLSTSASQTSVTITLSAAASGAWDAVIDVYSFTASSIAFDVSGSGADTACTSCTGKALTLTGTSDVIVQACSTLGTVSAISSPYTSPNDSTVNFTAGSINTASGTAPTWTQTSSTMAISAVAIKEVSSASATKGTNKQRKYDKYYD